MPTLRLAQAVALAGVLSACGDRASSTPEPAAPAAAAVALAEKPAEAAPPAPGAAPADSASALAPGAAVPAAAPGGTPSTAPAAPTAPAGPSPAGGQVAPATSPAPAAPAPPAVSAVIRVAVALGPGGASLPLARDGDTVVDPAARFEVVLSITSPDARLVLLDSKDAAVAAEEAHEIGQSTRLTLAPSAPLTPGRRYALRIDGASTRELHDSAGKPFVPSTLAILVAGTAPPEPKEQPTRRKRRR